MPENNDDSVGEDQSTEDTDAPAKGDDAPSTEDEAAREDYDLIKDVMTRSNAAWFLRKHPKSSYAQLVHSWLSEHQSLWSRLGRVGQFVVVAIPVLAGSLAIYEAAQWIFSPPEVEDANVPAQEFVASSELPPVTEAGPEETGDNPNYLVEFRDFVERSGFTYFTASDLLNLGGGHFDSPSCVTLNSFPPEELWDNIVPTVLALEDLQRRVDLPMEIVSAYRTPAYNRCLRGATQSQHLQFNALDFSVEGAETREVAEILAEMRAEGDHGWGIGLYDAFIHLDTRGTAVTWPRAFSDAIEASGE